MTQTVDASPDAAPVIAPLSRPRAIYAIGLLTLIYMLSFIDRQILSILAEPIKRELHLADWQVGAMTGLAFALLYTFVGIPIARIAEHANRRLIIAGAIALWSVFTMLCGVARSFPLLLLARIGVGLGEAGCTPPAHSLISDYVAKERRAFAIAIYMAGSTLGSLFGLGIGGVIADQWGWRAAFLVVGAPGVVLALVSLFTLPEPRRVTTFASPRAAGSESFFQAVKVLWRKPTYRMIVACMTLTAVVLYGMHAFLGSFFFRNHGPALAEMAASVGLKSAGLLGIVLGLIFGGMGAIGSVLGGWLADKLGSRDARLRMLVPAVALVVASPFFAWAVLTPSLPLAFGLMAGPGLLLSFAFGPCYSIVQGVAPIRMRATATAFMLFIISLVSLGLGPLAIGGVSDIMTGPLGLGDAIGIRWSLATFSLLTIPAGLCLFAARKTLREDTVG